GGSTTLDGSAVGKTGSSSTSPDTGNISTSVSNDLLVAGIAIVNQSVSITAPTNFTAAGKDTVNTPGQGCYRILSGTVTNLDPTWTLGSAQNWAAGVAAIQPGGGGGGATNGNITVTPLGKKVQVGPRFDAVLKVTSAPSGPPYQNLWANSGSGRS